MPCRPEGCAPLSRQTTPDELVKYVLNPELWLADEIEHARKLRDAMPEDWERERVYHQQQLDALEALRNTSS
jgi:hypothetical protein